MRPYVFVREGFLGKQPWRQLLVIQDAHVTIFDMEPALLGGWNFGRRTEQGGSDWCGMTADQIVAWKEAQYPGDLKVAPKATCDLVLKKIGGE